MKFRPVGAKLYHADSETDGRTDQETDMTKGIVVFRSFTNVPNNSGLIGSSPTGGVKEDQLMTVLMVLQRWKVQIVSNDKNENEMLV